jgi:uncharacterized protein YbbC (DUF1343 family)
MVQARQFAAQEALAGADQIILKRPHPWGGRRVDGQEQPSRSSSACSRIACSGAQARERDWGYVGSG